MNNYIMDHMRRLMDKVKCRKSIIHRLILWVVISTGILSTTYSSVFFMKGDLLWALIYGMVMVFSGWCVMRLRGK